MRPVLLLLAALLLTACAPAPAPAPPPDPVTEAWYGQAVEQLTASGRDAERLFAAGQPDAAAAIITRAQPVEARLLAAPRPTLAALEAASDLDCLYARMLTGNRHFGWARLLYQKDLIRWKNHTPQTSDTELRQRRAAAGLAACDRGIEREVTPSGKASAGTSSKE